MASWTQILHWSTRAHIVNVERPHMRLVNICVSDRPGSDISAALCNCTQPAPCPLLQWFGQLVTVTVHECNWSITLHCTFTAQLNEETSKFLCTSVYCTEQSNATNLWRAELNISIMKFMHLFNKCWLNFHFGPLFNIYFHFDSHLSVYNWQQDELV